MISSAGITFFLIAPPIIAEAILPVPINPSFIVFHILSYICSSLDFTVALGMGDVKLAIKSD
jgi:hypothetical protein